MRMFLLALVLSCLVHVPGARAIELTLTGDRFWVVLASRQDVDEAIAIAQRQRDDKAIVVHAANGWYAAVIGPREVRPGTGRLVLDALIKEHGIPKDAYFSRGSGYTDVAWTPPATNVADTLSYDGEHDTRTRKGDLEITLSRRPDGQGAYDAVARGTYKGKPAFEMVMADNPAEKPASQVELVRLDPASPLPQVVFTYFWQGAHCCTVTKIATLTREGAWHVIDGDTLDGGGGYGFEDLEGQGFSYLISSDQSFLYAFASYAESIAPIELHQLVGDRLVDVTKEGRFRHRLLQDLDGNTLALGDNPDNDGWHSNGFLAGWVAGSLLVERGETAWSKMLANYDHHSDFGPERCTANLPIDKCPDDKKVKIAFPVALKQFLIEHGYMGDPEKFPVPHS